jgi:hypothetical protein
VERAGRDEVDYGDTLPDPKKTVAVKDVRAIRAAAS